MVMSIQPHAIPTTELPSPSASETSLAGRREPEEVEADTTSLSRRTRSKTRRSPSRLPLRTGFRSFSGVATVRVGEPSNKSRPETKYLVHKELLTSASPFFAAALNGTFAEGLDQEVRLPEEKPEIFEWFLQWLYTGTLKTPAQRMHYATTGVTHLPGVPVPSRVGGLSHKELALHHELARADVGTDGELRNSQGSPKYFLLLDLYALSDRLLTTQLSNHVLSNIARLSETTNSVPTPSDTWILYDNIRDNVPMRTLILDLFAYKKTDRLLEEHKDEWHPRFLRELCVKLKRPGPESISRHEPNLHAWRPANWANSKACEVCREILQPGISGERCSVCEKAFCTNCMRGRACGDGRPGIYPTDTSGCKPWTGRNMCLRYHEHEDGEVCA